VTEGGPVVGQIHSGTKRPLGVRRRGRIEQLAIALRSGESQDLLLRVHSRTEIDKPLIGYEVFTQNTGEQTTSLVGRTNRDGTVRVSPGKTPIQLLTLRSGGQLLARLPVVPGDTPLLEIPLPDDDLRLQAESRLLAMREELIDLVARRNILMARVRQKIKKGEFPQAQQLLGQLDELPGRAQFNQALSKQERMHHAEDPQVQKKIDRLFAQTRALLGRFLDSRPISELHTELREAKTQAKS